MNDDFGDFVINRGLERHLSKKLEQSGPVESTEKMLATVRKNISDTLSIHPEYDDEWEGVYDAIFNKIVEISSR